MQLHLTDDWPPERIKPLWPQIVASMARVAAIYPDRLTTEYILHRVLCGKAKLWVVTEEDGLVLAFTTEEDTMQATGLRVLTLAECGGERLKEVLERFMPEIEAWARARGIDALEMPGRPGWARQMRPYGFEPQVQILAKRIT